MTSQNNSRKLHESGESIDNCLLSQGMKHIYKGVAENFHGIFTSRDHYRAFICSRNMNKTLDSDGVKITNYRKIDKERGVKSYKSKDENDHPSNASLTVQTSDFSHRSIADGTQKLRMSAGSDARQKVPMRVVSCGISHELQMSTVSFDVGKHNELKVDDSCNKDLTTPYREKNAVGVGSARERYLNALGIENSTTSCPNVSTVKYDHRRFEPSLNNSINKDSNPKKIYCRDQTSKECNTSEASNLSLFNVNTQGYSKGKHPLFKQLVKSAEAPSSEVSSTCSGVFSEQVSLQKCRSSMSVNPSIRATHCPSPDLPTPKSDISIANGILNAAPVQSLKSKFGGIEPVSKTMLESASSCVCSQNPRLSVPRVKIKASSTIQRIQEQLLQKMEYDEAKGSSSKTNQKFVHKTISEQYQNTENIVNESGGKSVFADKLHKEEKPYRQWHRMSRVVTADSKFIISPGLPCHAVSHTKQNNPVVEQSAEVVKLEELKTVDERKDCSVECEPDEATPAVDVPISGQETETCEKMEFYEASLKTDCEVAEVSLTGVGVTSCDEETRQVENGNESLATTIRVTPSDDCTQTKSPIATELGNDAENMNIDKQQTEQDATCVTDPELSTRRTPKSVASLSMPRNKSLNLKTFYMTKYQSFNEVTASNTRDRHNSPLPTDVVDRMQPINSISGASQVTGPCFSEFKNDLFKLPSKKIISGGPKLRTATRSRNRCNSPGLTQGSTSLFRNAESQIAFNSHSRNTSRHSQEGSRSFSSARRSDSFRQRDQRICVQPRNGRCARVQETELDNPECINRNWSGRCAAAAEAQKESVVTPKKPRKVFLADVASKLMQKVNRTSLRVPRNEPAKKYTEVKATQDYNGFLPGQLSFRKGQIIKQRSFVAGPSDGMCYGYYRVGRLRKKKKGLFPMNCVATDEPDALDGVSLTSSANSAI